MRQEEQNESIEPMSQALHATNSTQREWLLSLSLSVCSPSDVIANDIERRHRCQGSVLHHLQGPQGPEQVPGVHR